MRHLLLAAALFVLTGCPGSIDDPARFGIVVDAGAPPPGDDGGPEYVYEDAGPRDSGPGYVYEDAGGGYAYEDAGGGYVYEDAGTAPLGGPEPVTVEAEAMTLETYVVDPNDGDVVRIPDGSTTGTASFVFDGAAGTYTLVVGIRAENDGRPGLAVYADDALLYAVAYPPGVDGIEPATLPPYTVSLAPGSVIRLEGTANEGAWARLDYVELTP